MRQAHWLADLLLLTRHSSIAVQRGVGCEGPSTAVRLATGGGGCVQRAASCHSPLYSAAASLHSERHVSQRSNSIVAPEPNALPCFF